MAAVWAAVLLAGVVGFFAQQPVEARHEPWHGPHVSGDGWYYYHNLRSLALDHDLDLENEYAEHGNWYGFKRSPTGRCCNPFGIGPALIWMPAFYLGHGVALLAQDDETPSHRRADGYSPIEQITTLSVSMLAGIGAALLGFLFCRRSFGRLPSTLGALAAFVGGPLLWYTFYEPALPHALSAFFVSASLLVALPLRQRSLRSSLALGALVGLAALMRPQNALLLLIPAVETAICLWRCRKDRRARIRAVGAGLLVAATTMACLVPQLLAWKAIHGAYLVVPQGAGFMRWTESMWSETLFSSRHGLFTSTPILWLVLPGVVLLVRRTAVAGVALVLVVACQVWVNGAAWDWWAGGAYGARRLTGMTPVFAVALAAFFAACGRWRRGGRVAPAAIFAIFIAYQLAYLYAFRKARIGWDEPRPFIETFAEVTGWSPSWLHARVGTPLSFPANLIFALRHGVPLERYDYAVGPYLLDERVLTTNPLRKITKQQRVKLAGEEALPFLGRGLRATRDRVVQDGPVGELLLPLNRPGSLTALLRTTTTLPDGARLSFNGTPLPRPARGGRVVQLAIDGARVQRGINVLRVLVPEGERVEYRAIVLLEGSDWPPAWARRAASQPACEKKPKPRVKTAAKVRLIDARAREPGPSAPRGRRR